MGALRQLPNIAAVMEAQLHEVGIDTPEQLREAGSREAWLRILDRAPSACYNRLCGLESAIRGVRWHNLDDAVKRELKAFYTAHKGR